MRMIECRYKTKIKDIQDKYKFKIFCYDATGTSIADFNANAAQKTQEFNQNAVDKTNDFDEHASSIQAELDEVQDQLEKAQQELNQYKMLENALPKVEGEGESITLDNTAKCPMKLNFKGQIQQDGEPTPTNPIDIHIVSGDNEIKVCNKNLLNITTTLITDRTNNGITTKVNDNQTITISGTASSTARYFTSDDNNKIFLKAGTYTISTNSTMPVRLSTKKISGATHLVADTFTIDEDFYIYNGRFNLTNGTTYNETIWIQLEKGSTATSYVRHQEYTKEINLGELEVGGIGEYEDEFFENTTDSEYYDSTLEQDKWYLKKRIGKKVLDGSETWTTSNTNTTNVKRMATTAIQSYVLSPTSSSQTPNILSYYYLPKKADDTYQKNVGISLSNSGIILIYDSTYNTDDTSLYKAWLGTHNLTIYYVLATPTNILLNDTLQETLDSFYSWQEQTNISQENNDLPFVIKASAIYDLSNLLPSGASLTTSSTASLNKLEKTDLNETPSEVENIEEKISEE